MNYGNKINKDKDYLRPLHKQKAQALHRIFTTELLPQTSQYSTTIMTRVWNSFLSEIVSQLYDLPVAVFKQWQMSFFSRFMNRDNASQDRFASKEVFTPVSSVMVFG